MTRSLLSQDGKRSPFHRPQARSRHCNFCVTPVSCARGCGRHSNRLSRCAVRRDLLWFLPYSTYSRPAPPPFPSSWLHRPAERAAGAARRPPSAAVGVPAAGGRWAGAAVTPRAPCRPARPHPLPARLLRRVPAGRDAARRAGTAAGARLVPRAGGVYGLGAGSPHRAGVPHLRSPPLCVLI